MADDPLAEPFVKRYERFRAWADDHDVALESAFALREESALIGDRSDTVLVLPVLCLAVRVGGETRTHYSPSSA